MRPAKLPDATINKARAKIANEALEWADGSVREAFIILAAASLLISRAANMPDSVLVTFIEGIATENPRKDTMI